MKDEAEPPRDPDDAGAFEWISARLSERQLTALKVLASPDASYGGYPSDMGIAPATLHSMWDFRRAERDCWAPLMLVAPDFDYSGRRCWGITKYGLSVLGYALSTQGVQ